MREARVGVVQVAAGDKEGFANLLDAVSEETSLIVAPEYLNALPSWERTNAIEWIEVLESAAVEYGVSILAGLLVEEEGCRYSAVVHARPRGGVEIVYRKRFLFRSRGVDESQKLCPGRTAPPVIETSCCRVTPIVCYELRYPEMARHALLNDAEVLVVPSAWYPGPLKEELLVVLARARAVENGVYVVVANQPAPRFTGRSMIVSPLGYRLASAGPGPAYIEALLNPDELREARSMVPLREDALQAARLLAARLPPA